MVISWVYGIDKALGNLREMGIRLNKVMHGYWWLVWTILTPIASLVSTKLNRHRSASVFTASVGGRQRKWRAHTLRVSINVLSNKYKSDYKSEFLSTEQYFLPTHNHHRLLPPCGD